MKVLLTGFLPFDGERMNPALEAVKRLPDRIGDSEIIKAEIPVVFEKAGQVLEAAVNRSKPDIVLCIGQAGGTDAIRIERVAINLIDARIPDNEGVQPIDAVIREEGENAYFATVPVKNMVKKIQDSGIPAQVSFSAGSYVCNALMYEALFLLKIKYPKRKAGFIHVPYIPQQLVGKAEGTPAMPLETIIRGLILAIEAVTGEEIKVPMGTLQ